MKTLADCAYLYSKGANRYAGETYSALRQGIGLWYMALGIQQFTS